MPRTGERPAKSIYSLRCHSVSGGCSMSRVGECYANAVAKRFFWSLKHEWTKHEAFVDLVAARLSVFKYVEAFYNPVRLHQKLGYKSPDSSPAAVRKSTAAVNSCNSR